MSKNSFNTETIKIKTKGTRTMIKINDKILLECMNAIQQDLLEAGRRDPVDKESVADMTNMLRKVLKNKSINLFSAGLLYEYVSYDIEELESLKSSMPEEIAIKVFQEWDYIRAWIEANFVASQNYGLVSISYIISSENEAA